VLALAAVGLVIVLAGRLLAGPRPASGPMLDAPMARRTEYGVLAAILGVALAVRLVGWSSGLTPAFWFSEISTLHVDDWLRTRTLWPTWVRLLSETSVLGPHDAALAACARRGAGAGGPRFGPRSCPRALRGLAGCSRGRSAAASARRRSGSVRGVRRRRRSRSRGRS
jgi:hypothetical protein